MAPPAHDHPFPRWPSHERPGRHPGGKNRGRASGSYPTHATSPEIGLGFRADFFREYFSNGSASVHHDGWLVMAIVRRTRNPWKRAMMALRAARGTVFVLRHGSTDRNRGGVGQDQIRGHADIPMTPGGEQEVKITAWQIGKERIAIVHASDLKRTMRTAEILSDENVGYPDIVPTRELRSWDMGAGMEGKVTTPDVVAQIRAWVRDDTVRPPGGESFRGFATRLLSYVEPVFAEALAHGDTVAVVAHGRCVQVIDFWVAAGCDEACMHQEFAEYLAEEPDTVPPGGGLHFKHDGLGWVGTVISSGVPSMGTKIAAGAHVRPANELATDSEGIAS